MTTNSSSLISALNQPIPAFTASSATVKGPVINKKSAELTKNIAPIFSDERYRLEMAVREEKKRIAIARR